MVSSASGIFDNGATYTCYSKKVYYVKLEEKMFPRKLKGIARGLDIYRFRVVEYSVRSESERMLALRDQSYYVPGLPKYFLFISPQGIITSEGYKGTFISHCNYEHNSYAELNFKEDKPGWKKAEPVKRVYIKYDPKNNLPTHEDILPNQREK